MRTWAQGLGCTFCCLGFYLTRREKNRFLLPAFQIPHPSAQLTLAPLRIKVNQGLSGHPCRCMSLCPELWGQILVLPLGTGTGSSQGCWED